MVNPETQETAIEAGSLLDEDAVELIERLGVDEVRVRTPLSLRDPSRPVRQVLRSGSRPWLAGERR